MLSTFVETPGNSTQLVISVPLHQNEDTQPCLGCVGYRPFHEYCRHQSTKRHLKKTPIPCLNRPENCVNLGKVGGLRTLSNEGSVQHPPWWVEKAPRRLKNGDIHDLWSCGVRAGSRWPFTRYTANSPDHHSFGEYLPYPFFMAYAATYAKRETGADVSFRDSLALSESYQSFYRHLEDERYDIIFVESATPSWDHDGALIRSMSEKLPGTKFVLCGPISANAESILLEFPVAACIKGEYEKGAVKVIEGAQGIIEHDLLSREEMNAAPYPYMDAQHAYRYWDSNPQGQVAPHAQVWSSRGCPFKCIFCVWPATMTGNDPDGTGKRSVRHYTPDYMEGYLSELVERYQYKSIYFDDDTCNLGNGHVVKMCEVMSRIGLPWSAMCRADTIRMETWKLMRDAGCFGVKLGFESGNQWVVDNIVNKHLDLEYASSVVHELKRLEMTVHGTFTYGLPGETLEQMMETKRFIKSLPFDSYQESGTAEIEGTPLATLREKGALEAYAGAAVDEGYEVAVDGAEKWRGLAQQLQMS